MDYYDENKAKEIAMITMQICDRICIKNKDS
jgi:hypothetical protein